MATAPRPGVTRRAEAEDVHVTVKVDGKPYTLRPNSLSMRETRLVRDETGHSLRYWMQSLQNDPDIDSLAVVVWLSRLLGGEDVAFEEVASDIGYQSEIDIVDDPAEEDGDSPEA